MINILLADDHDLVRLGIKRLLADATGITVVGEVETGEDAIILAKKLVPNIILLDANMPGIGGLEACKRIIRYNPEIKVIALTVHMDEPYPSRFLQAGASGYLTKGTGVDEMVRAIRQVNAGQRYISAEVAQQLALRPFDADRDTPFEVLSEREMQVMLMITSGEKVQQISNKLCLSPKTVNSYRYRLFDKLSIDSDVALTHLAIRHGIIDSHSL
ncbi:MAG: UvrY/SirA/GacA family response regulator transcription factor [Gammaproteobacteria bacterium]|nr:UvrY/SirA/GacA family response regulator transcription factor [Gammaproteobacteria bacterium]